MVDPPTWPVLLTTVGSSIFSGPAVSAAQSQLWALGFDVTQPYSGEFDAETKAALAAFQSSRSIPLTGLVDSLTWHLLVTGCNSSKTNYWGFDVGWPQGSLSQSQFSCLLNQGYSFMTQEVHLETGNIWPDAVPNIQNALAAGFTNVWAYHFFNMTEDPYDQVTLSIQTLVQVNAFSLSRLA